MKNWIIKTIFCKICGLGPASTLGYLSYLKWSNKYWTIEYFYCWLYYRLIRVRPNS